MSATGSPFNGVKVGQALILLGGIPLWWAVDSLVRLPLAQLVIMAGYGLAGMGWTMLRTRRVLRERSPIRLDTTVSDAEPGSFPPLPGSSRITFPHPSPLPGGEGDTERRGCIEVGANLGGGWTITSRGDGSQ